MQPQVGLLKTEGDDHATIHDVRSGFSGIWSHVDCSTSRYPQRRPGQKRKSVLYVFALASTGCPVWHLGCLPTEGRRGCSSSSPACPPAPLLSLTAPSQRMRRSFLRPGHALDFLSCRNVLGE